ncbi:PD-(D/E)XK nuclease family protein [Bartonella queenslandensis]|uniref:PD-(D/E)XK nuclease family protein n=1 Tax=Bartonella queenslandensis TaxID=481138 RepID=UPI00030DB26B|nr:PD-(D/E)XK nuclease family protein [Bartonella queenslandensis]
MLDFNHRPRFAERLTQLIDEALCAQSKTQPDRDYLGASRLGETCSRKLQYEYTNAPKDEEFSGRTLRIFAAGHVFEDLAIKWLRLAGFELFTETSNGGQFGFSAASGRIRGHVDGIINNAPEALGLTFPMLWECKSLNNKSWQNTVKRGVAKSKPIYAAQIALYQAYMEGSVAGISRNPALFTAINKDTAELHFELVPFDAALAQTTSERAVSVLKAVRAHELLPRHTADPEHFECRFCAYNKRCWEGAQ